jgi:short-subunit dehydrogenase
MEEKGMTKKTALITGATSGLGYEFVKLFANDGCDLVLVARNNIKLSEMKNSFKNVNVTTIAKDLSIEGAAREVFEQVEQEGISIDFLVNNAGFGLKGSFDKLDIQKQLSMIQLNTGALTELTYYFLQKMKQRNNGRILNVASTAAFQPGPLMAVYFATKAYVLSLSEALMEELSGTSITVTALCPGATKTNFGAVANVENSKMFSQAMSAEVVAKQGYAALMNGKRVFVPGGANKAGVLGAKFMPRRLAAKVAKYVAGDK